MIIGVVPKHYVGGKALSLNVNKEGFAALQSIEREIAFYDKHDASH